MKRCLVCDARILGGPKHPFCQDHRRIAERIRWRYGVNDSDILAALIILREDGCEICGTKDGQINIDHDHSTGVVRGWLCSPCNLGLGGFKDSPKHLAQAIVYLKG